MKKLVLALTAIAAFSAPALAADMAAKAPMRAAPVAYAPSWTGCYVGGGLGYGMYNVESDEVVAATGAFSRAQGTSGGRGYFGNVQAGCDYQFGGNWVVGAFGDYSFMNVNGDHIGVPVTTGVGNLKQDSAWAVGGRIGYLVTPSFLSYFSGGWTEDEIQSSQLQQFRHAVATTVNRSRGHIQWLVPRQRLRICARVHARPVPEDRIPVLGIRPQDQITNTATATGLPLSFRRDYETLYAVGSHVAGLPLQLGRPGRREVLISPELSNSKAPAFAGAFLCAGE